jgi:hypothetical protein
MRQLKKPARGPVNSNQQQSNIFKTSLKAWQARFKEQRATQLGSPSGDNPPAR